MIFEVNFEQFNCLYSKILTDGYSLSILGTGYKKDGNVRNPRFHYVGWENYRGENVYYLMSKDLTEDLAKSFYENQIKQNLKDLGEFFKKDNEKDIEDLFKKIKYKHQIDVKKTYEYLKNNYEEILSSPHNDFFY